MPFEQKYSDETREKALARVLERRESEPGNRSIIRETAEEFEVGEQSLRGWIRAHEKANAPAVVEPETPADEAIAEAVADAAPAAVERRRPAGGAASGDRVAQLEEEVTALRRDRDTLKAALAVLLRD